MLCFNSGIDDFQELARHIKVNLTAEGELAAQTAFPGPSSSLSEADGRSSPGEDAAAGTEATACCLPSLPSRSPRDPGVQ